MFDEKKTQRVLIVANSAEFLHSHRIEILTSLAEAGVEVHVACGRGDIDLGPNIRMHRYRNPKPSINIFAEMLCLVSMFNIIRTVRPCAIHLLTIKPHIYGLISARLLRINKKIVALAGLGHLASEEYGSIKHWLIRCLYKGSMLGIDVHFIVQNERDRDYVYRYFSAESHSITQTFGSGVAVEKYAIARSWAAKRPLRCIFASRLLRSKGVLKFFDIAQRLKGRGIEFAIFGARDLDNPDSISEAEERLLLESDVVQFKGFATNMAAELQNYDVMVYPSSYGEGIPKILLEASASGLPVITTDNPGCAAAVEDGATGHIFSSNDINGMVDAIFDFNQNREKLRAMSDASAARAAKYFDVQDVVRAHLRLYETLLNQSTTQ